MIGISARLGQPSGFRFYRGTAVADESRVPWPYPVALAGHPYIIDLTGYARSSVDILRQAYDQTGDVGEQSLSIEGFWKRFSTDWAGGAGQRKYDAQPSDRARYYTSKGVDPWKTDFELCLLNDTAQKRTSTNSNLFITIGSSGSTSYLYMTDGTSIVRTANPDADTPTFATVTGTPGTAATAMTGDGASIWTAHAASGVYEFTGTSAAAQITTTPINLVCYANGFLFGTYGSTAYTINRSVAATALTAGTIFNTASFNFTTIAGSPNAVFFGGNAGDRGQLFACTFDDTTGGITPLIPSGRLPEGEQIYALAEYGGIMILGTSRGIRLAQIVDTTGLAIGPLIDIGHRVRCFEPQGDEIWFGWENYDGTSTGLGRTKLSRFTDTLVPAYSSDLMATGQGSVLSAVTYDDKRYFTVSGLGLYGEIDDLVATGTIDTGWIAFSTPETKVAASVDVRHAPLAGSVTIAIVDENETTTTVGVSDTAGSLSPTTPFGARGISSEQIRLQLTLARDGTDPTDGPCLRRWLLRSMVSPDQPEQFVVPIILHERVDTSIGDGQYVAYDTYAEFQFLKGLEASREPVIYQEGTHQYRVTVRNVAIDQQGVRGWNNDRSWFNATVNVRLVTFTSGSS